MLGPDVSFVRTARLPARRSSQKFFEGHPDLAVEIDRTNESLSKLPIYATLGIPEIWRYDVKNSRVQMYELQGSAYLEVASSRSFPILTGKVLADFIEQSKVHGQKAALAAFHKWMTK